MSGKVDRLRGRVAELEAEVADLRSALGLLVAVANSVPARLLVGDDHRPPGVGPLAAIEAEVAELRSAMVGAGAALNVGPKTRPQ